VARAWTGLLVLLAWGAAGAEPAPAAFGIKPLPANPTSITSAYSRILLDDRGSVRTLSFVRDSGEVVVETSMDLAAPDRLLVPYTRHMFVHYLLQPEPRRALLVGLGGGAMVRFLERHDPDVAIDAIDIDPAIVRVADEYFGVRSHGGTRVAVADAFEWIGQGRGRYDVIYMDAFLKPAADTDPTGAPLRLKTRDFLAALASELRPGGAAVFNVNQHEGAEEDVAEIRRAFPQAYVFRVSGTGNVIVAGSTAPQRMDRDALAAAGRRLDERFAVDFSFAAMARDLVFPRQGPEASP
jgi:spermidine synthase